MRLKKWQGKLLSGILCASLIFQSLSVTSYASENISQTQISVEQETTEESIGEIQETVAAQKEEEVMPAEEKVEEEEAGVSSAQKESEEVAESAENAQAEETVVENTTEETTKTEALSSQESTMESDTVEPVTEEKGTESTTEVASVEESITEEVSKTEETVEEVTTEEETTEEETTEEETTTEEMTVVDKELDLLTADGEVGYFENISMLFTGFNVELTGGVYYYPGTEGTETTYLQLVQYDKNDNKLCAINIKNFSGTSASTYSLQSNTISLAILNEASYVRMETKVFKQFESITTVQSEKFPVGDRPNVTFQVDDVTVGAGTLSATVTYDGDLCLHKNQGVGIWVDLSYGTSKDESTWTTKTSYVNYSLSSGNVDDVYFTGLTPGQTYYGKITIYERILDDLTGTYLYPLKQSFTLDRFTAKSATEYKLSEAFPDAVLRARIIQELKYQV